MCADIIIDEVEILGVDIDLVFGEQFIDLDEVAALVRFNAAYGIETGRHGRASCGE